MDQTRENNCYRGFEFGAEKVAGDRIDYIGDIYDFLQQNDRYIMICQVQLLQTSLR